MVYKDISPNGNLEKLSRKAQELASEKKKKKIENSVTDKKRKLWYEPNNNPVLLETEIPTPHHCK